MVLFSLLAWKRRAFTNVAWLFVFAYLLIDDALLVHETFGNHVAEMLSIEPTLGLRPNDLGELFVTAIVAVPLLGGIGVGYLQSGHRERAFSRSLLGLLFVLAFFGILGDMIHVLLSGTTLGVPTETLEDGGEWQS